MARMLNTSPFSQLMIIFLKDLETLYNTCQFFALFSVEYCFQCISTDTAQDFGKYCFMISSSADEETDPHVCVFLLDNYLQIQQNISEYKFRKTCYKFRYFIIEFITLKLKSFHPNVLVNI